MHLLVVSLVHAIEGKKSQAFFREDSVLLLVLGFCFCLLFMYALEKIHFYIVVHLLLVLRLTFCKHAYSNSIVLASASTLEIRSPSSPSSFSHSSSHRSLICIECAIKLTSYKYHSIFHFFQRLQSVLLDAPHHPSLQVPTSSAFHSNTKQTQKQVTIYITLNSSNGNLPILHCVNSHTCTDKRSEHP